jgi:hypothetical protein
MEKRAVLIAFLIILSGCFIGKGITGFATGSESCCFGLECPVEKRCSTKVVENPGMPLFMVIAGIVLLIIIILFIMKLLGSGY